jgi:AhpD family alkylhydroperoxidase
MARVRSIPSTELPADLADIYESFAAGYGPFRNQVAVFAHVPAALRHLMAMLMELRAAATLPKRYLELAIVAVSKLNECDYCVAPYDSPHFQTAPKVSAKTESSASIAANRSINGISRGSGIVGINS